MFRFEVVGDPPSILSLIRNGRQRKVVNRMLFQFQLRPVEEIPPWGREENLSLGWFGLTDGWYWLKCGDEELFRFSDEILKVWKNKGLRLSDPPYFDYSVVRLWEDIIEMLPAILEPIPFELLQKMRPGRKAQQWSGRISEIIFADEKEVSQSTQDHFLRAITWPGDRRLDTGYLKEGPRIWFWTEDSTVFVKWDNSDCRIEGRSVWASASGTFSLPLASFVEEVRSFDNRLIHAMNERAHSILQHWSRPQIQIDKDSLLREQQVRATWLSCAMEKVTAHPPTRWDEVIKSIELFEEMGFACGDPESSNGETAAK